MKKNLSKNTAKALAVGLAVGLGSSAAISGVNGNLAMVKAAAPTITADGVTYEYPNLLTLTFDQELKLASGGTNVQGFSVLDSSNQEVQIISQGIKGDATNKVAILLDTSLSSGTYKVKYEKGNNEAILNSGDEELAGFEKEFTVDITAPTITTAEIEDANKTTIKVTFDEDIQAEGNISNLFTVTKNGTALTGVTAATDANNTKVVNITIPGAKYGETYKLSYAENSNNYIKDNAGNKLQAIEEANAIEVTNNIQRTLVQGDNITADGFKFEVLANTSEVFLIGKETTKTTDNLTGSKVENGTLKINLNGADQTLTIKQIGDGATALEGNSFTIEELNNLCAEATTIEVKAFDNKEVTGGTKISFPKVTNIKANALAFKSGITEIELPAVTDASKINDDIFKTSDNNTSSVKTVAVNKNIKDNVTLTDITVQAIPFKIKDVEYIEEDISGVKKAKVILTANENITSTAAITGFSIKASDGTEIADLTIDSQEKDANDNTKIVLTLSKVLENGNYKLEYTKGTDAISGASGELENFKDKEFTVNVDRTAPTITTAEISNDAKNIIKLTFSEEVDIEGSDIKSKFTVKKGTEDIAITNAEKDTTEETVINITLPEEAKYGDVYTLTYTGDDTDYIKDKVGNKLANIEEKNAQVIKNNSMLAIDDEIETADGFKFKVLADNKVVFLGKKSTTTRKARSTSGTNNAIAINKNVENGKIKLDDTTTLTITQIGNGTDVLTGTSFTTAELNKLCAEATIIEAKAFDGVDVTGGTTISLPKVEEVKANSLAFKSGITKVELPAIKDATKINTSAFKSTDTNITTSVKTLAVDKTIQSNVKLEGIKVEEIKGTTPDNSTTTTKPSSGGGSSSGSGAIINSAKQPTTTVEGKTEATTSQIVTKNLSLDKVNLPTISDAMKSFTDIPVTHWASEAIGRLSSAGIIQGMPNGTFNANGNTKRADMTVMLVRLLGINETFSGNFSDINPNAYYANAVGIAREYGIVTGSTDGKFNPNANISRQDTMVMIARILQNLGISVNNDTSVLAQFSDSANVSQYALEATAILVNAGIINGNDGRINPKAPITRAEIAVVMNKLYSIIDESKKTAKTTTTEATTETTTANGSTTETTTANGSTTETTTKNGSTTETTTKNGSTETTTKEGTTETTTETTTK